MFDSIKKLFKRNKSNETGIVTLDNLVNIPSRNDLMSDEESTNKLDKYKHDYLNILTNKNTLTSHKLSEYNGISDKVKMYTDLNSRIILDEEELFNYQIANKDELSLKKIDIKNKLIKINLYLNDIQTLEKEIILHLIALKEIKKEKVFFSQLRKRPLEEEINTLTMALINISSQKRAIEIETNTALKKYELLNILNKEVDSEEQELIDFNYESLIELISKLNINNNISTNTNNKLISISQMEKDIEIYCYKNKINKDELMINILKEQLNNLKDKLSKSYNPESYMPLVKYYERKCIKYYKQGLITEDVMPLLYELKFYILTSDINSKDRINIREDSTAFEFEYYKKIIENILKLIFKNLNNYAYSNETEQKYYIFLFLLKLYMKLHKDANNKINFNKDDYINSKYYKMLVNDKIDYTRFNYYEILGDKEILSFILSIYNELGGYTDSKNSYKNFLENKPVGEDDIIRECPFGGKIEFDKETKKSKMVMYYLRKIKLKKQDLIEIENESHENMYCENDDLYFLGYIAIENLLPKPKLGIVKIEDKFPFRNSIFSDYEYTKLVDEKLDIYDLIFPDTLKAVDTSIFCHQNYRKVILNEGLEVLDANILNDFINIDELTIPSTIKKIRLSIFEIWGHIKKIVINNIDNLKLEDEPFRGLVSTLFEIKTLNNRTFILIPKFDCVILNFNGDKIKLSKDELNIVLTSPKDINVCPFNFVFSENNIPRIKKFFKNKIKEAKSYLYLTKSLCEEKETNIIKKKNKVPVCIHY